MSGWLVPTQVSSGPAEASSDFSVVICHLSYHNVPSHLSAILLAPQILSGETQFS